MKKAIGKFFDDDGENEFEEEYAVKVFDKRKLKTKTCSYYDKDGIVKMKTQLD